MCHIYHCHTGNNIINNNNYRSSGASWSCEVRWERPYDGDYAVNADPQ